MMAFSDLSQQHVPVRVALEPVFNALNSFALLNESTRLSGLNTWVTQTAAALTPEQRHTHRLVFEGLRDALTPRPDEASFPSYLHHFSELNPLLVRKMVVESLRKRFSRRVTYATPNTQRLLEDAQAYLHCVETVQGENVFDPELQMQVHHLLQDPPALQQLMLSHLEMLWQATFAAEWRRVQRSLHWQVEMFTRSLDEGATLKENFRILTGRELPADAAEIANEAASITLIPSWHTGRHVTTWDGADWEEGWGKLDEHSTVRLFFSEPPNYDVAVLRAATVGRAELRARLAALADETRLRILELLAQHDEMLAQDMIAALELSQSSVSRHLKQLVSLGYLYERRGEGANKTYRLSSFYIERTTRALEQFVSGEHPATKPETADETQSQELKRFLDRSGKLTLWPPAKQRDKLLILEYLASFFEPKRRYSEKEVNELLLLHTVSGDSAALRRALYEYRFMNRTRDGSHYWLIGSETLEEEG